MTDDPAPVQTQLARDARRSRPAARGWPWLVAVASLLVFALSNLLYPSADADPAFTLMFSGIIGAFVFVGALLVARVPGNPIGYVMLGSGAFLATTVLVGTLAILGAARATLAPEIVAIATIVNDLGFIVAIVGIMVGIPLIFPDGRLLSPRWRWVVALVVFGVAADAVSQLLGPGPIGEGGVPNPFAVPALYPLAELLDAVASTSVIAFVFAVLAVVVRYRRAGETERHQLKWLIAVAMVATVALPVAFLVPDGLIAEVALGVGLLATFALPLAIAIAVLRYRLYDIDRIISRTIGWALVTAMLVAAFGVLVVGLQNLLTGVTQGETLAVAASTLAAVALFQPVRRVVQGAVDRRFDRASYDARGTADAFAERVRDEVDLDALAGDLVGTVTGAMRPSAAWVWLPTRDPNR